MNDYIRSPGYGITTGSANTYTLILTPSLTSYTAGVCVAIKIHAANTGASTININGLGAKSIKDSKGNNLTSGKLVLNSIYTLRYDGTNFILQGEGGEYGTATVSDVLAGKTIGTDNGLVTGTIASKGAETFVPSTSNRTIASGQYLSGVQTISPVTGTAVTGDVLSGKTFSSAAGIGLTGTIPSKGVQTYTPSTTNQTIAAGQYLSGIQTIAGSANLVEENIKNGINIFGKVGAYKGDFIISSGSNIVLFSPTEKKLEYALNSPTKMKEIRIDKAGTYRSSFESIAGNSGYTGAAQIYINAVPYGSPTYTTDGDFIMSSYDIALNAGDLVQIYGWGTAHSRYAVRVRNFNISINLTVLGIIIMD